MQQIQRVSVSHYGCIWQVLVQDKLPHVVVNVFRRIIHERTRNYQHAELLYSFKCASCIDFLQEPDSGSYLAAASTK